MNDATALSDTVFHGLMADFAGVKNSALAIAVSGGPDSMALAYLARGWCVSRNSPLPMAFIVDHGLRAESAAEANEVKRRLKVLGIDSEILHWEHAPVTSRLHHEARKARYRLLLDACHRHKTTNLLFAHQRDDQAETILMRLAKGTGIDGLAGIPAESVAGGIRILRPFLTVPKDSLIATCEAAHIPYITDPSNGMEKFARGRLRRVLPLLAEEGLTVERLVDCGQRAAEAKDALEFYTSGLLGKACCADEWGCVSLEKDAMLAVPRAIALRGLSKALQAVHAEAYAPQHASLTLLLDSLKSEDAMPARTLNGCLVGSNRKRIAIFREHAAIHETAAIKTGESIIWDGRWQITLQAAENMPELYTVRALGTPPHEVLDRLCPGLRRKVPQGRVRAALPALWLGDEIAAIPFNPGQPAMARLVRASGPLSRPK